MFNVLTTRDKKVVTSSDIKITIFNAKCNETN